jgi:hypothetical protein
MHWLVALALAPSKATRQKKKKLLTPQPDITPPLAVAVVAPTAADMQLQIIRGAMAKLSKEGSIRSLKVENGFLVTPPEVVVISSTPRRLSVTSLVPLLDTPTIGSQITPASLQEFIINSKAGTMPSSPVLQALPFAARVACAVPAQEAEAGIAKLMKLPSYNDLINVDADLRALFSQMESDAFVTEDPQSPILAAIHDMLVYFLTTSAICGDDEGSEGGHCL